MKIIMSNGNSMEIQFVSVNGVDYVLHQELKKLEREDKVIFDFPYINASRTSASVMCIVSRMDGTLLLWYCTGTDYGSGSASSI